MNGGFALIFQMGNWFGGSQNQTLLVVAYLIMSVAGTAYFVVKEFQSLKTVQLT